MSQPVPAGTGCKFAIEFIPNRGGEGWRDDRCNRYLRFRVGNNRHFRRGWQGILGGRGRCSTRKTACHDGQDEGNDGQVKVGFHSGSFVDEIHFVMAPDSQFDAFQ